MKPGEGNSKAQRQSTHEDDPERKEKKENLSRAPDISLDISGDCADILGPS
jgi:hypothetical protein